MPFEAHTSIGVDCLVVTPKILFFVDPCSICRYGRVGANGFKFGAITKKLLTFEVEGKIDTF